MSWHVAWLLPRVTIEVQPSVFVWRRRQRELHLATRVFLDQSTSRVVSVGHPPPDIAVTEVQLFDPAMDHHNAVREAALRIYFLDGLRQLLGRNFFMRPYVVFSNSEALSNLLHGYEKAILARAAMAGGASDVTFTSNSGRPKG